MYIYNYGVQCLASRKKESRYTTRLYICVYKKDAWIKSTQKKSCRMITKTAAPIVAMIMSLFTKTADSFECYTGDGSILRHKVCPSLGQLDFTDLCFKAVGKLFTFQAYWFMNAFISTLFCYLVFSALILQSLYLLLLLPWTFNTIPRIL